MHRSRLAMRLPACCALGLAAAATCAHTAWAHASAGFSGPAALSAQTSGRQVVHGVVRDAETGAPLTGAVATLVGTRRSALTGSDGAFRLQLTGADADQAVRVGRIGYRSQIVELVGEGARGPVVVELVPSPIALAGVVVTGALTARTAEETLRPVNVVAGEELQGRLEGTVASALEGQPGLAVATMGPATASPVIRGLGGDRVLMLEDGARVGDVSSSGSDHATALDASTARRVEVVRGPAALLYGSSALGGVVNVIRDEIPTTAPERVSGAASLGGGTVSGSARGSAAATFGVAERVPLRVEASARRAGDLKTPAGVLGNTAADTWTAGAGASYLGQWGHAGASFRAYRNDYGIPGGFVGGHEAGVRIEMERVSTKFRGVVDQPAGPYQRIELRGVHTWYRHQEIEPPDILGTFFKLQATSAEALAVTSPTGPFSAGALGFRASREDFAFGGDVATPDTRRTTLAAFVFQEMEFDPIRIEGGLRYDWTSADPLRDDPHSEIGHIRDRAFRAMSGSLGIMYRAGSGVVVGATAGRAFRTPDVNELYSEGPHLAAYYFEVGNPSLEAETGNATDLFVRYGGERLRAEVTGFYNAISGYVYGTRTGETSRVQLPIYQYQGNDAVMAGFEAAAEWDLGRGWAVHGAASYVRGELEDTGRPLPLIPPLQGRAGVEHEHPAWFVRGETEFAARQDRVDEFETPTDGYVVLHAAAGVRVTLAGRLHVITANLRNATNQTYRNHLSRVKEIMPEAGRGLSLAYRVVF